MNNWDFTNFELKLGLKNLTKPLHIYIRWKGNLISFNSVLKFFKINSKFFKNFEKKGKNEGYFIKSSIVV